MWSPTHIQVTVHRAKGLLIKGKNGTNNCFVTIALGKEKYQTSIKDKAEPSVNWNEECELKIPDQGNRAELILTCLHRNTLGIDEFLGQFTQPLNEMDVYDRPRSRWFKLESKPGKEKKSKERGELEVRISFIVKSGSLTDLSKKEKNKSSIGQLATSVGGSLLSIGAIEKRKGIKKFAKSLGSKMHLQSKKKNKDSDDGSFSGSFASIGTPSSSNGGSRRYGQRAGEADPGVISEDEDEFAFENLSHKSSGSSLNIRGTGMQASMQSYAKQNPSPLLGSNGKDEGKQQQQYQQQTTIHDLIDEREIAEIENDFSVRARTLPPPSKPPRTQQQLAADNIKKQSLSEWEKKIYGKNFENSSLDSLKRRSWETTRVPLTGPTELALKEEEFHDGDLPKVETSTLDTNVETVKSLGRNNDRQSIMETDEVIEKLSTTEVFSRPSNNRSQPLNLELAPEIKTNDFKQLNASFAKFEQRNSAKIFDLDDDNKSFDSQTVNEAQTEALSSPVPQPRLNRSNATKKSSAIVEDANNKTGSEIPALQAQITNGERMRREEDKTLDAELISNERRQRQQEAQVKDEVELQEELRKRDARRFHEDQRILNFAKRNSISVEESDEGFATPPAQESPKTEKHLSDKKEKRLSKLRYFNKREKNGDDSSLSPSPKFNERIIIGHEKSARHAECRPEITAALSKKYDGKTREELMLIANGMENEALLQRQRVKELEDYLDNLLLRVMETHPKILQNPYSRTTSAKSG